MVINYTSDIVVINDEEKIISSTLSNTPLKIRKIFTPEHGLNNMFQAGEIIENNDEYNIPIISLYGKNRSPKVEDLLNLDALVFDIQDIGSRYYTYVSTMTEVMNACAKANIPLIVLDRPNPISGFVNGPLLSKEFSSFVGMHPIPTRHGMTIGELSYMINNEAWLDGKESISLYVYKMYGWDREMYYDETGFDFIPPSPNIPDLYTAIMYSGMCLLEGTNISEGRGTEKPFMQIGAPWIDAEKLLFFLEKQNFSGINFKLVEFIPQNIPSKSINPKYLNKKCYGISFIIIDKTKVRPIEIVLSVIDFVNSYHSDQFSFNGNNFIDKLYGSDILSKTILENKSIKEVIRNWETFNNKDYLLY